MTDGHYHLYLDKRLTWKQYEKLLEVMAEVGILEKGYVQAAKAQGMTLVRKPKNILQEAFDVVDD